MVKQMLNENFQVFLQRLKVIEVTCFPGESAHLPSHFIQSFPSLEKLILSDAFSDETILHELKHPCSSVFGHQQHSDRELYYWPPSLSTNSLSGLWTQTELYHWLSLFFCLTMELFSLYHHVNQYLN